MATTFSTNNSGASRTMPTEFTGLINLPPRAGEGARLPVRMWRIHGFDPLTRPAPADEDAGCGPPSPPKGRGKEIRVPHPLSIHPCRRTNVETPGSRKQACGRESGSQLAGGQSAVAVGNRVSKLAGGWSLYILGRSNKNLIPRPFGGEGGPPPALSPAGAGRVRGSKYQPA